MQSVYKMPIGAVARKQLDLNRKVAVTPADYAGKRQHSPMRDRHHWLNTGSSGSPP
jgi:hypothetical protein